MSYEQSANIICVSSLAVPSVLLYQSPITEQLQKTMPMPYCPLTIADKERG